MERFAVILLSFALMGMGACITLFIQREILYFKQRRKKRRKYKELSREWENRG